MEETVKNDNVQYYEIYGKQKMIPIEKFKYTLIDIQLENISEGIRDDYLKTAILEPENLQQKFQEEKEAILYDLTLLENTSVDKNDCK
jgi:hypothetical protein